MLLLLGWSLAEIAECGDLAAFLAFTACYSIENVCRSVALSSMDSEDMVGNYKMVESMC